jgi:hypothetical protein
MHMHHIAIRGLSGGTLFFHTVSRAARFSKNKLLNTKCVFWFSLRLFSETFLILRRTERAMIKIIYLSAYKYPLFLSSFNETWIFSTDFGKTLKCQVSRKFVQWEPCCCMRTDRRTDMTKVAFRNFANAPNKGSTRRICDTVPVRISPDSHHEFRLRFRVLLLTEFQPFPTIQLYI